MSNIREIIRDEHDGDNESTAARVFATLGCPAKWRDIFYPLVLDECRRYGRAATVAAICGAGDDHARNESQGRTAVARPAWLAERVYCGPDHGYVVIGRATVEQHRERIAFQMRLRAGIDADIARHRTWIDEIEAAGVQCLDDLYVLVPA